MKDWTYGLSRIDVIQDEWDYLRVSLIFILSGIFGPLKTNACLQTVGWNAKTFLLLILPIPSLCCTAKHIFSQIRSDVPPECLELVAHNWG